MDPARDDRCASAGPLRSASTAERKGASADSSARKRLSSGARWLGELKLRNTIQEVYRLQTAGRKAGKGEKKKPKEEELEEEELPQEEQGGGWLVR